MSLLKIRIANETTKNPGVSGGRVGGVPNLPMDIPLPRCTICGDEMTFFFQVSFPKNHSWAEKLVSLFCCTTHDHAGHEIPRIYVPLNANSLAGADLPDNFLQQYQTNFNAIVSNVSEGADRLDYHVKIAYRELYLKTVKSVSKNDCAIADTPVWRGRDEAPGSYQGEAMEFLFQVKPSVKYHIVEGAPLQARRSIHPSLPSVRNERNYILFVENALYVFGNSVSKNSVYIICQRP